MIDIERPEAPDDFDVRARPLREAVADAVVAGDRLPFDTPLWAEYKDLFAAAQRGKCAYCEMSLAGHDPAIDHYAPKSEVWELSANEDERGRQISPPYLSNVTGRRVGHKLRGYWWRAYDWRNFLLTCSACNSKWKRCYFPIAGGPRARAPEPADDERPLLLNPYDESSPWREFEFTEMGHMLAIHGSERGRATIETLGFDQREDTRLHRQEKATAAYCHARAFLRRAGDGDHREEADWELRCLCELGLAERDHAGMVRSIAERITGLPWEDLVRLREVGLSAGSRDTTRSPAGAR